MDDRIPTKPGRMKITPEDGSPAYYATVEMADEPTQVGTALNKENLLSDPVAMAVGLTASAVPDDMFDVMAHAGDLHVWRRTVETFEKIPAKYSLGPTRGKTPLTYPKTPTMQATFHYGKSISIDDNGGITINGEQTVRLNSDDSSVSKANNLKGSFFYCDSSTTIGADNGFETGPGNVYFIPSDAIISREPDSYLSGVFYTSKYQKVYTTPAVPPGTYIDYPVSVNPNAYQEGADGSEKPAGYKLGSKITGNIALTDRTNESSTIHWNYSDQVDVSDDGKVSLIAPNRVDFNATQSNAVNMAESPVGNFIMTTSSATAIKANTVYFIPDDASVAREMSGTKFVYTTAIQSVTGYPAIPAGTTIEYLGVLGDKTSIETGSYVGTGTYGSKNPNTLTFRFEPKFVHIQSYSIGNADGTGYGFAFFLSGARGFTIGPSSSNDLYPLNAKFNKNILSWYQNDEYAQLNEKKVKYFFAALG